jgi:hypothetical protein
MDEGWRKKIQRIGERKLSGFKDEGMRKTRRKYRRNIGNKILNQTEDDEERTKKVKKVQHKE